MIINRLSKETSPYLQQHASNPVDWYPWGEEALNKARTEKKPILLSIGYSACHWCHVMAHESFEDDKTAKIMNKYFINIKVDREERPDLDKIYQTSQILLNQKSGGWPLTMFISHENHAPFFGGTYFPNEAKYNLPSFKELLIKVQEYYKNNYEEILKHNKSVIKALESIHKTDNQNIKIEENIEIKYLKNIKKIFDPVMGGFGSAPKFPQPSTIMHTFNYYEYLKTENEEERKTAINMSIHSLVAMQEGGINDQLDGGFFRYSVDDVWMIPHFEKMLYDNACLLECYCKAYQLTKNKKFYDTAKKTADWLINEMQSTDGGFYSSIDADSDDGEGQYYVWDKDNVKKCLDEKSYNIFSEYFGLNKKENFEKKHHLYVSYNLKEDFKNRKKNINPENKKILDKSINKLHKIRNKRKKPFIDKKILTSWNALAINSLLEFYKISKNSLYLNKSEKALYFLIKNMFRENSINATYKDGVSHINAYLDDYAFLINAFLNFLSIKWNNIFFKNTIFLSDLLISKFFDNENGGFFFTSNDHEILIQKPKPTADEAFPSGNSIAAKSLLKVGYLMNNTKYLDAAESVYKYSSTQINDSPNSHSSLLDSYLLLKKPYTIIILKTANSSKITKWQNQIDKINKFYIDCYYITDENTGYKNIDDKLVLDDVTAYICNDFTCEKPITNINDFISRINLL